MFFYNEPETTENDGVWEIQLRQTWEVGDIDYTNSSDGLLFYNTNSYQVLDHSESSTTIAGDKFIKLRHHNIDSWQRHRMWANKEGLVSISQNTAISVRALVLEDKKYSNSGGGFSGHWALTIRGRNDGLYDGGYSFGQNNSYLYGPAGNIEAPTAKGVWKRYRLDLIPQIQNGVWVGDKLCAYVADGYQEGAPNWILKQESIQTSVLATHETYKYNQIEWHAHGWNDVIEIFVDDFEIYTSTDLENL